MDVARPSKIAVCAAYAAIYLIWGSSYLAVRFSVNSVPPLMTGGFRFLLAGSLLFVICAFRRVEKPALAGWRNAFFASLTTFLLSNGLLLFAEVHAASSIAALISALEPLWFCLFGWLFFHGPRPGFRHYVAIAVGLAATYFVIAGSSQTGGDSGPRQLLWILMLFGSSFAWVIGNYLSKDLKIHDDPLKASGMVMICASAEFFVLQGILSLCTGNWPDLSAFSFRSVVSIVYLAVFASLIGYTSFLWLMRVEPASRVSTYAFVNPVTAVFLGWLLAGEQIHRNMLIATPLVVVSVALMIWTPKKKNGCSV
jgi:drug/metabolite transporter (DMT)-like permease